MAENSNTRLECRPSALDVEEDIETDVLEDPSPYDSDTEEVDIDSFVKSISHHVNDWEIYDADNFTLEKIGDGFFGDIYKATDSNTGKIFVVKTMKKPTKMKLMCAEIRLMARLKHPNILRFLGVSLDNSGIHLVTEYMEIGNLEEVVADYSEPLPWSLRMKLAHDISKGMAYLHSVGVIHRDLASKNVLISKDNNGLYTAVIADFGLAAKIPSRKKKLKVVGSPYWMAPEVLRHDQYNETVDIFSYGIILCEIIGRVHSSPDEIPRTNHFGLDVDKFCEIVQGCPPEFLQLAVCCCQLDPQSRPPFELTARFLEYIRQLDIVVGSPTILKQDTVHGSQRMSANIEDWIIDSKKTLETSVKNFPPCAEECVCENGTAPVTNGCAVDSKPAEVIKSDLDVTPCRRGHPNKRHSFFAGLRYKYFKPHVDTEDLVKNTPSKLAGFFTRVLHVQKKHKLDGRKKARSKTTYDVVDDRPRLRSFRMILTHKERSDLHSVENEISPRDCLKPNGVNCSGLKLAEQDNESGMESPVTTPRGKVGTSTATSSYQDTACSHASSYAESTPTGSLHRPSYDERTQTVSPVSRLEYDDETDNLSSCENDNPYLTTWSESSFREGANSSLRTDVNGFYDVATPIPRCFSESDVEALRVTNDKARTFTPPRQSPQKTKRKNWNIFSLFQRRGREKQKT